MLNDSLVCIRAHAQLKWGGLAAFNWIPLPFAVALGLYIPPLVPLDFVVRSQTSCVTSDV